MPMLTTRTSTRQVESHSATSSFEPARLSTSSSSHLVSSHTKSAATSNWSLAPCSSYFPDHHSFGHQDSSELATVADRGPIRAGYTTRSSTGTLPRSTVFPEQNMGAATLFANGPTAPSGAMMRKKRRRYGPKPEPPYTCFCGKVFKRHEHMLRHRATHDDGIKYECHICGKCFRRQDVMHRHTMTHTSRNRLQNKMRTTASASSSSVTAAGPARKALEDSKALSSSRKREQEHVDLGHAGLSKDVLEDPTLRVGLAEYPVTPTSFGHNEDHHIAAAQLYSACNGARSSYPPYAVNIAPGYGVELSQAGNSRSDGLSVLADYHARMGTSMSPPPAFFPPHTGMTQSPFEPGQLSVALARPHLGLSTFAGGEHEYEPKVHAHDASHYAQSWHGGHAFAHGSMHMGASESEWSEQSPSGPSSHTFASPAWSHKAELMRREGAASASGGTPLGVSSRQLLMDPAMRWHAHQQHSQPGTSLVGADSGFSSAYRSPAHEPRRRLSTIHAQDSYPGNMVQDAHAVKADAQSESGGAGLGLFDHTHGHESGNLGFFSTPTFTSAPAMGAERMPTLHHSSPHTTNGTILASPSHYLDAGMSSMHVSQVSNSQHSSYASENKQGLTSMLVASEPFDTGSPLTEAEANASPGSPPFGGSSAGQRSGVKEESCDPPIDPHLIGSSKSYPSSSSGASTHDGQNSKRW